MACYLFWGRCLSCAAFLRYLAQRSGRAGMAFTESGLWIWRVGGTPRDRDTAQLLLHRLQVRAAQRGHQLRQLLPPDPGAQGRPCAQGGIWGYPKKYWGYPSFRTLDVYDMNALDRGGRALGRYPRRGSSPSPPHRSHERPGEGSGAEKVSLCQDNALMGAMAVLRAE